MITSADLKTQTKQDLSQMAKRLGVNGWNALSKDQLVAAILKTKTKGKPASSSDSAKKSTSKPVASKSAAKPATTKSKSAPLTKAPAKSAIKPAAKTAKAVVVDSKKSDSKTNAKVKVADKKSAPAKATPVKPNVAAKAKDSSSEKESPRKDLKKAIATNGKTEHSAKANGTQVAKAKVEVKSAAKPAEKAPVDKAAKPIAKPVPKPVAKKPVPKKPVKPDTPPTNPVVLQRIRELQTQRHSVKDLSGIVETKEEAAEEPQSDRIVLVVRDAYWLQASWDVTRRAVERARAAMAEHWHLAQPKLRVLRLDDSGTTSAAETIERDIDIHGGVRNWYIDLNGQPGRFRVMIGYASGNRFHMLAKSNIVRTPAPGTTDSVDDHWSDIARDAERIFALSGGYDSEQETTELQEVFEDRLKRSMGGPQLAQYGSGAEAAFRGRGDFYFDMEVELYVYGATVPDGFVTLNGEPVKLRTDGTFAMRLPFPDRRQVLPAVACSRDGVQQRTVVIAVERNTKVMEPFSKEQDDQS